MKKYLLALIPLLLTSNAPSCFASEIQSIASIQEAVHQYISTNLTIDTEYDIKLSKFDSRLKLPLCTDPLETFSHKRIIKAGRNSVGVKCNGTKKWTIYTSITVSIFKDVIVLSHPIRRGEIFSKNSLKIEKKDISTLRSGYLTDPMTIIQKQATRNLSAGRVVTESNFTEAQIIRRGERVYITVNNPNFGISMAGIAMMNGIKGQNIKVKNIKSQQIIQATVAKPGQVVVLF